MFVNEDMLFLEEEAGKEIYSWILWTSVLFPGGYLLRRKLLFLRGKRKC